MATVRVLLVEDDEDDYVITRDLLAEIGQCGYELDWAKTGEDALARLRSPECNYDVCLLDYRLGRETGLDIIREASKDGISVPMVLLTEHSDRQIDLLAMQEGASDFLVKSEISSTSLDRVIRYVCAVKKHERERLALALAVEDRKQAEELNKSKDDFLGMVSHELRGPINSILLWVELLKSPDIEPDMVKTAVDTIERSVKQQAKILDDLVDLTRSLNQLIKLYKQAVNLVEIVGNVVTSQQPIADEKAISITYTADNDSYWVEADPDRLHQVFNNLLGNSLKFTPEHGQVCIDIRQCTIERQPFVEVSIQDTGIGMTADLLPFVFDRYLQAPTHSYGGKVGLGLGMTIARQLVELHGGTISAKSAGKDEGATFVVALPLLQQDC